MIFEIGMKNIYYLWQHILYKYQLLLDPLAMIWVYYLACVIEMAPMHILEPTRCFGNSLDIVYLKDVSLDAPCLLRPISFLGCVTVKVSHISLERLGFFLMGVELSVRFCPPPRIDSIGRTGGKIVLSHETLMAYSHWQWMNIFIGEICATGNNFMDISK